MFTERTVLNARPHDAHLHACGAELVALAPLVAPLARDKKRFVAAPRMLTILDEEGECIRETDEERRFFEGAWVHKRHGVYFLSYSTGSTHRLVYATAKTSWDSVRANHPEFAAMSDAELYSAFKSTGRGITGTYGDLF